MGGMSFSGMAISAYRMEKSFRSHPICASAEQSELRHLVLICNAVNFIDASALETLADLQTQIQDAGIQLYLTEVKGPVMDRLAGTDFLKQLGEDRVFLATQEAYETLRSLDSTNDWAEVDA